VSRLTVGTTKAGCFTDAAAFVPVQERQNEVANVFYIPVCTLNLASPTSSRTIQSVEQLQYGCAFVTPKNTRLRYAKGADGGTLYVRHVQNFIGPNNSGEHEIAIPKNSELLSVYQDPTQQTNSLTTTAPTGNDPDYIVAQVSTDQNGDIVSLIDWNAYQPYNKPYLENVVIP